ncbi:MAG: hypothetical protein ACK2UI_08610 [Anaerolineae bacterium]
MNSEEDRTAQVRRIKQEVEQALLKLPGVTGVDIGEKMVGGLPTGELAIRVYVAEKKPTDAVPVPEQIPAKIQDVPTDVIQRKYELHSGAMAPAEPDEGTD